MLSRKFFKKYVISVGLMRMYFLKRTKAIICHSGNLARQSSCQTCIIWEMRGGPKPLFCQTPRVKNRQSLQISNSLPRDSEPLVLALSQMTCYEYDMLKLILSALHQVHKSSCVCGYCTCLSGSRVLCY